MNENFTITGQSWQPGKPKWELLVWDLSSFDWNKKSHWLCVSVSKLPRDFDFLDHICPKRVLPVENIKSEHHHGIFAYSNYFWHKISVQTENFDFLDQICPKKVFPVENKKSEHHRWILRIRIRLGTKFQPKLIIFFSDQLCPKTVFRVVNRKSERHHWILSTWIILSIKFQVKLTKLIFWTKFALKGYFRSKTEKVNITTEFCIFELV